MDRVLQKEMRDQQKAFTKPDLNAPLKQREDLARQNMSNAEKLVDQQIFSGDMEKTSQERLADFSHNYVYKTIEDEVKIVNSFAADNIRKYRKAEPTEQDKENAKKIKEKKVTKAEIVNKPAKAAGWKQGMHESSVLESSKEMTNPMMDLNGVRETEALIKYQNQFKNYIDRNDEKYVRILDKNTEHAKSQDDKNSAKIHINNEMLGTWPFMKLYKKGWFGRIYTLDGKRIKTKKGQLTPDEYNKELMEAMTLQTEEKVSYGPIGARAVLTIDKDTLKKNREKKAKVLRRITKELLDYKLDVNQLTDEYLADHITEIQQYADKLNAFEKIYANNKWFFLGNDKGDERKAEDKNFIKFLDNRIFDVSYKLNDFLDAHYCCHGMVRNFRREAHMTYHGPDGFLKTEKPLAANKIAMRDYRKEHLTAFGNAFDFYDTSKLSKEELEAYKQKVEKVRSEYNNRLTTMDTDLKEIRNRSIASVGGALNDNIKEELDKIKKKSEDEFKAESKNDKDLVHVPYDIRANGLGPSIMLGNVKKKIVSHAGFYPQFAPEVNKLYAKMYATSRLEAELFARQRAIKARLYEDKVSTEKKERRAKLEEQEKDLADEFKLPPRPINEKNIIYNSKNTYANEMMGKFMVDEVKKVAEEELADVERKLEYLRIQQKGCAKTIEYFLTGAKKTSEGQNLDDIKNYCRYENMELMFNAHKVDSFDAIMQQCKAIVRTKIHNKDTGEDLAIPKNIKVDQLEGNERNERLYKLRKRQELASKTSDATTNYVAKYMHEPKIKQFADIARMSMEDIQTLSTFKDEIPVEQNGAYNLKLLNLEIFARDVMTGKEKDYTPKHLKNDEWIKTVLYDTIQGQKPPYEQFKAEMQVKFEILAQHSYITDSLWQMQLVKEAFYFDIDSLKEMSDDQIKEFDKTVKDKLKEAEDNLKFVRENPDANASAQDHRLREATSNYENLVEFQKVAAAYISYRLCAGKYTQISVDLIQTKTIERMRANRLKDVQQNKFAFAGDNFLEIEDMFADQAFKNSLKTWPPENYIEERDKNKNHPMDEAKTLDILRKRVIDLTQIHIDTDTIELLNNFKTDERENPVNIPTLKKLLQYTSVISDFEYFIDDSAYTQFNIEPAQYQKDMKNLLARPENADIMGQITTRMTVLQPLIEMVKTYLHAQGFSLTGEPLTQYSAKALSKEGAKNQAEDRLDELNDKANLLKNRIVNEMDRVSKQGFEGIIKDYTKELFEKIYKEGEPLELKNIENWRKRVEKVSKKGFFGENQEEMWLRLTAQNMLENWPYAFNDFYSYYRMREDANKFKSDLKKLGITEDENFIKRAAKISQIIKQETMGRMYALDDNETKEFDRQLLTNKWDPDRIKLLMDKVETTDTHEPKDARAKVNRQFNSDYAKQIREYLSCKNRDDMSIPEVAAFKRETYLKLIEPVNFGIKLSADAVDEKYIQKHFGELYRMAVTFGGLQELYKQEKKFLHTEEAKKRLDITKGDYINMHNAYDYSGSVLSKYFEMILAYAESHCVNEEGGLSVRGRTKEKALEKMSQSRAKFEKLQSEVGVELRRKTIAENAKKANHVSDVLDSIEIKSGDKMIKMVQKSGFEGFVQDVNLFLQNDNIYRLAEEYTDTKEKLEICVFQIDRISKKGVIYSEQNNGQQMPQKEYDKLNQYMSLKQQYTEKKRKIGGIIKSFHEKNKYVYDSYVECHDKNCNLNIKDYTGTNPVNRVTFENFERFQNALAPDMKDLFVELKNNYAIAKKNNNVMFDKETIGNHMRSSDWPKIYRNYRKLNLYLSLLEQDLKNMEINVVEKELSIKKSAYKNELSSAKSALKKLKKPKTEDEDVLEEYEQKLQELKENVAGWERRIKGIDDTVFVLTKVFTKDNKETIEFLRQYCTQMNVVYREHGVTPDGELFENNIAKASGEAYTDEEKYKILYQDEEKNRKIAKDIQNKQQKK